MRPWSRQLRRLGCLGELWARPSHNNPNHPPPQVFPDHVVTDTPRLVFLPTVDPRTMTGTYTMTVTVSDPSGNKTSRGVVITVRARSQSTANVIIEPTLLEEVKEGSGAYMTVKLDTMPRHPVRVMLNRVMYVEFDSFDWDIPQMPVFDTTLNDKLGTRNTAWETSIVTLDKDYKSVNPPDIVAKIVNNSATLQLLSDPAAVTEGGHITLTVTSDIELFGSITSTRGPVGSWLKRIRRG